MTTFDAFLLAVVWGAVWAVLLQYTDWGRFLAARRTWLAVAIGVGVDLLILLPLLPLEMWLRICLVVIGSSAGIVIRSLANEWREHRELMEAVRGNAHSDCQ